MLKKYIVPVVKRRVGLNWGILSLKSNSHSPLIKTWDCLIESHGGTCAWVEVRCGSAIGCGDFGQIPSTPPPWVNWGVEIYFADTRGNTRDVTRSPKGGGGGVSRVTWHNNELYRPKYVFFFLRFRRIRVKTRFAFMKSTDKFGTVLNIVIVRCNIVIRYRWDILVRAVATVRSVQS